MRQLSLRWPASASVSALAALTAWVTLWAWGDFAKLPSDYLVPLLFIGLLVAAVGALLRSARLPAALVLVGQAAVVLVWLNHAWAAEPSAGGWLPTPTSLRQLWATLEAGSAAAQAFAAPVPASAPAFAALMTATGSLVLLLVDLLACGLRRVPAAGLPLLAVYTAGVSIAPGGVAWWKFAVGALCYLMLLAADEGRRLAHWGRQLSAGRVFDTQTTDVSGGAVRAAARKIGITATGFAVVAPLLVPTLSLHLFGGGNGTGGDGDAVAITNPMVDLKRDLVRGADRPLLSFTTDDPAPAYLRVSVLDSFDGTAWRPSGRSIPVDQRADGRIPRAPGLEAQVPRTAYDYRFSVDPTFRSRWLPVPYPAVSVRAPGDWRYDARTLDFISAADNQTTAGEQYRVRGLQVRPTAAELAAAGPAPSDVFGEFTKLPPQGLELVRRLAHQVTENAPSKFEKAVALQQWFRVGGDFRYSLDRAPGNGVDDLDAFLRQGPGGRVGYCEQFAAAMALMGRTLNIPSRVAVGFLRPDQVGPHTWVYSSHDLHAWPEMYFEGVGWVRFEPTPAARAGAVPAYTAEQVPTDRPSVEPSSSATAPAQNRIDRGQQARDAGGQAAGGSGSGLRGLLTVLAVLVLAAAVAALPRGLRSWSRRRRWAAADTPAVLAETAWSELRDSALDLGVPWDDSVSPRARGRDLVRSFGEPDAPGTARRRSRRLGPDADPAAVAALERLVTFVERARYARTVGAGPSREQALGDVAECVRALEAGAGTRAVRRARWLPLSVKGALATRSRGRLTDQRVVPATPGIDRAV